jgi:homoserine dehydrogenase
LGLNSFQTSGNSPGSRRSSRCRVGLLGLSPVGAAVLTRLTGPDAPPSVELTHICDRRAREKRARQPESPASSQLTWTDRFDDLLTSDVDIVVEAVGGTEPVLDYLRAALLTGKSAVTINTQVVAHHGPSLLTLAERQGRQLRFGGAVGGAMPIVRTVVDGLAGERFTRIDAILSGATNAVLSAMEASGCDLDTAIAEAWANGYAEAGPAADLDGVDAAAKLAVLCGLMFGLRVGPEAIEARTAGKTTPDDLREARERGGTIRQVAHAAFDLARGALAAWVAPTFVPATSVFARTTGPQNAAVLKGAYGGTVTLTGVGAGSDAMAAAIVSDLVTIARDRAAVVPAPILRDPAVVQGWRNLKLAEAV